MLKNNFNSGAPLSVYSTLLIAFLLNVLPLGNHPWVPDFLMIVMAYWLLFSPQKISLALAFFLGLVMDVQTSSYLGMHGFSYVLLTFLIIFWHRRLSSLPPFGQMLQMFPILLAVHFSLITLYWVIFSHWYFSFAYIIFPSLVELLILTCLRGLLKNPSSTSYNRA
ncbi:MAG: rod shape-determining protein MreD [Betaproteobacteria bacterium]|jgi:rod shape-determining protein MreD